MVDLCLEIDLQVEPRSGIEKHQVLYETCWALLDDYLRAAA